MNLSCDLFEVARDGEFVAAVTLVGVIEETRQFSVLQDDFGVGDVFVEERDNAVGHETVDETAEFVDRR